MEPPAPPPFPTGTAPAPPEDPALVQTLRGYSTGHLVFERFRLVRELGAGGMAVVWLAQDERLKMPVALKFLPGMVASDADALHDLRLEITRGLTLTHPGIVRLFDLHEHTAEKLAAIAMEYVDGMTLTDAKAQQPGRCFEVEEPLVSWTRALCEVLSYVHEEVRIIHRDLKPRNLMLTATGRLKVADFGIAATLSDSHSRLSQHMGSSGTPVYMSPQQALGRRPTVGDDVYALGATLYELLTSKPPFFRGGMAMILHQVALEVPPAMAERREEFGLAERAPIPVAWEETVAACLAKQPEARPASVRAVAERLGFREFYRPGPAPAPVTPPVVPIVRVSTPVRVPEAPMVVEPEPAATEDAETVPAWAPDPPSPAAAAPEAVPTLPTRPRVQPERDAEVVAAPAPRSPRTWPRWVALVSACVFLLGLWGTTGPLDKPAPTLVPGSEPTLEQRIGLLEYLLGNNPAHLSRSLAWAYGPAAEHQGWVLLGATATLLLTLGYGWWQVGGHPSTDLPLAARQVLGAVLLVILWWWMAEHALGFGEQIYARSFGVPGLRADRHPLASANLLSMRQMGDALFALVVLISAVTGRVKSTLLLLGMVLAWMFLIFTPLTHAFWGPRGWLNGLTVAYGHFDLVHWLAGETRRGVSLDYGGGAVIHTAAGWSALVLLWQWRRHRLARYWRWSWRTATLATALPRAPLATMVGSGLVWVGWLGLHGSMGTTAGTVAANAFTATLLSGAAGAFTWAAGTAWGKRPLTPAGAPLGLVAGLVTVAPYCSEAGPAEALGLGVVGAAATLLAAYGWCRRLGQHEPVPLALPHAVGGPLGLLAAAGLHFPSLLLPQAVAVLITLLWAVAGTLAAAWLLQKLYLRYALPDVAEHSSPEPL